MPVVNVVPALPVPTLWFRGAEGKAVVPGCGKESQQVVFKQGEADAVAGKAEVVIIGSAPGEGGVRCGGSMPESLLYPSAEGTPIDGVSQNLVFGGSALADTKIG